MLSANIMRKALLLIALVLACVVDVSSSWSQEFYILSTGVQAFAIKNSIFPKLAADHPEIKGSDRIVLYLDVMTFADVVASKRAEVIGRGVISEDFDLAFSFECLLPFGPVHERERGEIIKLRPKFAGTAFTNKVKRERIKESVNEQLIVLDKPSLIEKRQGLFQIMNVNQIIE